MKIKQILKNHNLKSYKLLNILNKLTEFRIELLIYETKYTKNRVLKKPYTNYAVNEYLKHKKS